MYIVELTYIKPLKEVDLNLEAHKSYLNKYYASGNFLLSGRKNPRTGGVILAQVDCLKKMKQIISEDPFNINGLAEYSITEFLPTMANDNLQFLLKL